jgi:hypothetical protein
MRGRKLLSTKPPSPSNSTLAPSKSSAPVPSPSSGPLEDLTSAPWTDTINQDILSDTVALTRDFRESMFNALDPSNLYDKNYGPSGTEWALLPDGMTFQEARCSLAFSSSFYYDFAQSNPSSIIGKPGVLHLINEDVYYNIMFTSWTQNEGDDYFYSGDYKYGQPQTDLPVGGGFQYIRDETPFTVDSLVPCPVCDFAVTDPKSITGAIDDTFVNVTVSGVTPQDATISIVMVAQDSDPKCNNANDSTSVTANAKNIEGNSVMLRRTKQVGFLDPFWYTIYFEATSEGGALIG